MKNGGTNRAYYNTAGIVYLQDLDDYGDQKTVIDSEI